MNISKLIPALGISLPLLLSGCGDPTLDLSGNKEEQRASLTDVVKSYDREDKIAFLSWYRGLDSQNKIINGRKASEIIKIIREQWKEDYIRQQINSQAIRFQLHRLSGSIKTGCEPKEKEINNNPLEIERLEKIKKDADLFNNTGFSCVINPNKKNSLLVTIKNSNALSLSKFSMAVDNSYIGETEIPGGIASGETSTLEIESYAVNKMKEGYECHLSSLTFYEANGDMYGINVYKEHYDPYIISDMPDYKDFINERIAYYEELAGKNDACKVIGKATGELSAKAIEKAEILSGISIKEEQK